MDDADGCGRVIWQTQQQDLATRIIQERERTKYWARILLLFPVVPFTLALSTVTVGGVVINAASSKCNSDLLSTSPL